MFERCALLLLASGLSSRFTGGDKLMAQLGNRTVLDHSAARISGQPVAARLAVVGTGQEARRQRLRAHGFELIDNPDPAGGQGVSLALGAAHVRDHTDADAVIIQLADMPLVEDTQLARLVTAFRSGSGAVISRAAGTVSPPALFSRPFFDDLAGLTGDQGALGIFRSCPTGLIIEAPARQGLDIDTPEDLRRAAAG